MFPAWTGCFWLGLRTTSTVFFACGILEKPTWTRIFSWPGPCSVGHHVQDVASHLADFQPGLHRTLLVILNSSPSFYLTDPAGLNDPTAPVMLHPDTFLSAEAEKYWTSHQSTSKPELSLSKPGLITKQGCGLKDVMPERGSILSQAK